MIKDNLDTKPLLPYALPPSPPLSPSRPPSPAPGRLPSSGALARFFATKRRWVALVLLYLLALSLWYSPPVGVHWAGGLFRWRRPHRVVHDAYGTPFAFPLSCDSNLPFSPHHANASTPAPLDPADAVFHLFPPGPSPSPALYLSSLETFLYTHFPPADTNTSDPTSLINALRSFFPAPSEPAAAAAAQIPQRVWQTAPDARYFEMKKGMTRSWEEKQAGWEVVRHDNPTADVWVRERFALNASSPSAATSTPSLTDGEAPALPPRGIVATWDRLSTPAVLRSDFWRYLVLAVEGGVYADTDVECLRPVEKWGEDVSWHGERPEGYVAPSLIVGIEADVGKRLDWHEWWPRPLQFSQWTIASARGHPVLLDTVRRVVEMALEKEKEGEAQRSVMERTGPGPFTDSVLSYLLTQYRKPWRSLRSLDPDGWRFRASRDAPELLHRRGRRGEEREGKRWGDIKVLSITGLSPGVGHMGAQTKFHPAAMASHQFAGSWRLQKGADV
ncbi:hypothetical protein JCM10207_004679 [Rhodosporidiobolus poonsookiae]